MLSAFLTDIMSPLSVGSKDIDGGNFLNSTQTLVDSSSDSDDVSSCLSNGTTESPGTFALALFSPCQQSHSFVERRVKLRVDGSADEESGSKIGRAVGARSKADESNAIFDCKVLSRNHALLWYEDGKFFLKDTKSSNGTFVNNRRLSKGSEESDPKELSSGDIVQFGVDIMEANKEVTHTCIIALVRLFHADGSEATALSKGGKSKVTTSLPIIDECGAMSPQELFQLQQYLREAAHREAYLEQKLASLQTLLVSTQEASQTAWRALIDEDRLLSRIEMLESQLQLYSRNTTDDKLKEELVILHEEKYKHENIAKESLRKALEEKIEAVQRMNDIERSLETTEEECSRLRDNCKSAHDELSGLMNQHQDTLKQMQDLTNQLQQAETRYSELESRTSWERTEVENKMLEMRKQESVIQSRIEGLQTENFLYKEQIAALKLRGSTPNQPDLPTVVPTVQRVDSADLRRQTTELLNSSADDSERIASLSEMLEGAADHLDGYNTKLDSALSELDTNKLVIGQLQQQLQKTKDELTQSNRVATSFEEKLKDSDRQMKRLIDDTTSDVRSQLSESRYQTQQSESLCSQLRGRIRELEESLRAVQPESPTLHGRHLDLDEAIPPPPTPPLRERYHQSEESEDDSLRAQLTQSHQDQRTLEMELRKYKDDLEMMRYSNGQKQSEIDSLHKQLQDYVYQSKATQMTITNLGDKLSREEKTATEAVEQNNAVKLQLVDLQSELKTVSSERDDLKNRLQRTSEDLEYERSIRKNEGLDIDAARMELHRHAARNQAEFASLKDECASLKARIGAVEDDMRQTRKENVVLSAEYQRLQTQYNDLDRIKRELETRACQVDTVRVETQSFKDKLLSAECEVSSLKIDKARTDKEIERLRSKLEMRGYDFDYDALELKVRQLMTISTIPLMILGLALALVFVFPSLVR